MELDREKVKRLRERLKLSQEAAASAAGMRWKSAWCRIETGTHSVSLPTLERVARVLGVSPKSLLK